MLQTLRDHVQGWIAGIIIGLVAIAFVFWGLQYYIERSTGGAAGVATVNGEKITAKELDSAFRQLLRQQQAAGKSASLSQKARQQLKQIALQGLITNSALLQAATDAGFSVGLDQVKQLVVAAPEFQVKGQFSQQRLQQLLYANSLTAQQFFSHLQATLVTNQIAAGIAR